MITRRAWETAAALRCGPYPMLVLTAGLVFCAASVSSAFHVEPDPGVTLMVFVSDSVTHQPLSGVQVKGPGDREMRGRTDSVGWTQLTGLPRGFHEVRICAEAYVQEFAAVQLTQGKIDTLRFALRRRDPLGPHVCGQCEVWIDIDPSQIVDPTSPDARPSKKKPKKIRSRR